MILFRRRYPRWWFDFALQLNRFSGRVGAYLDLLPALGLGAEPAAGRAMAKRVSRPRLVDGALLRRAFGVLGPTAAVVALSAFALVLLGGGAGGRCHLLPCRTRRPVGVRGDRPGPAEQRLRLPQ